MARHWCDTRAAKVAVGGALAERGWTLHGYTEDRSDMMTDYYAPATWDGVATHPARPGVVICVDVSVYSEQHCSGGRKWTQKDKGEPCERCTGTGAEPNGWTIQQAMADVKGWQAREKARTGLVMVPLVGPAVSRHEFLDSGHERCRLCGGCGHQWIDVEKVEPWPSFHACAKGTSWHVERDGKVVASGTGVFSIHEGREEERGAKLAALVGRLERAADGSTAEVPAGPSSVGGAGALLRPSSLGRAGYVEVVFAAKPSEEIRSALKAAGFRWAKSNGCWYGQEVNLPTFLRAA